MRVYTLSYCNDDHKVVDFASYMVDLGNCTGEEAVAPHKAFAEECEKILNNGYREVDGKNYSCGITMVYTRVFEWGCTIRPASRPERITVYLKNMGIRPVTKE